jgi:hypothetical protein
MPALFPRDRQSGVSVLPNPLRSAVSVTKCPKSSRSLAVLKPYELDISGGRGLELVAEQPGQAARADVSHCGKHSQRVVAGGAGDGVAQLTQRRGARQGLRAWTVRTATGRPDAGGIARASGRRRGQARRHGRVRPARGRGRCPRRHRRRTGRASLPRISRRAPPRLRGKRGRGFSRAASALWPAAIQQDAGGQDERSGADGSVRRARLAMIRADPASSALTGCAGKTSPPTTSASSRGPLSVRLAAAPIAVAGARLPARPDPVGAVWPG